MRHLFDVLVMYKKTNINTHTFIHILQNQGNVTFAKKKKKKKKKENKNRLHKSCMFLNNVKLGPVITTDYLWE